MPVVPSDPEIAASARLDGLRARRIAKWSAQPGLSGDGSEMLGDSGRALGGSSAEHDRPKTLDDSAAMSHSDTIELPSAPWTNLHRQTPSTPPSALP